MSQSKFDDNLLPKILKSIYPNAHTISGLLEGIHEHGKPEVHLDHMIRWQYRYSGVL